MSTKKITRFRDIPPFIECNFRGFNLRVDRLLVHLEEWERDSHLQMNPDFQREHVWTPKQQTEYMEFLFRGGQSGLDFYFNCPAWHHTEKGTYRDFVVVDGKQRIEAIRAFFDNRIPIFGSLFREFTDKPNLMDHTVTIYVNSLQTKKEVLTWYLQMNGGGTPHSQDELERVRAMLEEEPKPKRKPSKLKR